MADESKKNSVKDRLKLKSYISSIDTVLKSDSEEILGSVILLVSSSHTPVFIFTKENDFLGLISPYQVLYARNHPYTTKVSSIAVMPPYITLNTPLYDVASLMLESRVYTLPVFGEDKELIGAIHIKEILQNIIMDEDLLAYISTTIKPHSPIMSKIDASVGDIDQKMREKDVSRVVLIDNKGNLSGIVSRKDLLMAFMKPTDKQRFGKSRHAPTDRAFDEEKQYRKNYPIKKYMTNKVNSLAHDSKAERIIKTLISSSHNSIVLVDSRNKPVGFLSMHDILDGLASLKPDININVIISRPSKNVTENEFQKAKKYLEEFGQKMKRRMTIEKIETNFEEPKYPTGGTAEFNTTLIVTPVAGAKIVSKTKSRSFQEGIREAAEQIEKQQKRSGISRTESKYNNS